MLADVGPETARRSRPPGEAVMRVAGRRRGAGAGRVWRRNSGRVAVLVVLLLGLSVAAPPQGVLRPGVDPLPLSWLWDWFDLPAGWASPPLPPTPQQDSAGGAAGRSHSASTASTQAHRGVGQAPGKGVGQVDPYSPHQASTQPVTTPAVSGEQSFDPVRSKRVASAASATSDVFANPDASYTRKVYPRPVNFQAPDGSWVPVDTTLTKAGDGRVREKAHGHPADFAGSASDPVLAELSIDTAHRVGYGLAGAANVTPQVSGSSVMYQGVLPDTDLRLTTLTAGFKESLVLHSASAGTSWVFPLRLAGVTPQVLSDGSVVFLDSTGTVLAAIPHGSMSDSRYDASIDDMTRSDAVTYELVTVNGGPALKMKVDAAWLTDPARVFPVTVDPTVTDPKYSASGSTYTQSGFTADHSLEPLLKAGTPDGGSLKAYSFLKFAWFPWDYAGARFSSVSL